MEVLSGFFIVTDKILDTEPFIAFRDSNNVHCCLNCFLYVTGTAETHFFIVFLCYIVLSRKQPVCLYMQFHNRIHSFASPDFLSLFFKVWETVYCLLTD